MSAANSPAAPLPSRRDLLRTASLAGLFALSPLGLQAWSARTASARGSLPARRLLTIFLRGGNDAVNTLIPLHDAQYALPGVRPTLRIPAGVALDLGNGGAAFHPAMARALEVFQAGDLAAIARVGYAGSSLSHFSSQRFLETALPGVETFGEGWIARLADRRGFGDPLFAASVSAQVQRAFHGPRIAAHIPDLAGYALSNDPIAAKILGHGAEGLASAYASGFGAGGSADAAVRETGLAMHSSLQSLTGLPPANHAFDSFPDDPALCGQVGLPASWWAATFLANARDALRLLTQAGCTVAGIEMPGFDHHAAQGAINGDHAARLSVLAHALRSLRREAIAAGVWSDLAILVVSEFGRTSRENGAGGTDHGRAGLALLAGGRVHGGVHHCDPVAWPSGATLFSEDNRYVAHRTDYRALYAELLANHFGLDSASIDAVVPGFSSLTGSEFQPLGLFV